MADETNENPTSPNAGDPHTDGRERVTKRSAIEEANVFPIEDRDEDDQPSPTAQALNAAIEGEEELASNR